MEIHAMERNWIVLTTVLQAVMLTSVNLAETPNYRQFKARDTALGPRKGQLQGQAQVSTDRTFIGTRQLKPQKSEFYRRPSSTVIASVQRRQQQQQQQQQHGAQISYMDWTPIVQPREPLQQGDDQQQQVRQSDPIVTFVTLPPPPPPSPTTTTTQYNDELRPKNHVQHFDDESDDFRNGNHYQYVNASELSEGNNNKQLNVTRITNAYEAVDDYRKNWNFGFHDEFLEKNKTHRQNSYKNGVNAAKEQNKQPSQGYNTNDDKNNDRLPQSYDSNIEHYPRRYAQYLVNTDVLLQLNDTNNKHSGQIADVKSNDQKSQHLYLLDGESKSEVLRNIQNNITAAADLIEIDQYDNNDMYNTNAVEVANEQRLNYNEHVDDGNHDFYRNDNYYLQYVNVNGVVDERGNSTHRDAIVDTDSKAQKQEDGRKYVNSMLDASKNKQRVSDNQYVNVNVTKAAGLEADSVVVHKRRGHNDERGEIEHRRRRKPSVIGGAKVNPTISTTASPRHLRRKVQSSAQTRRPATDEGDNDDETISRQTLYDGQNGYEQKYNRNDRGRITTPSDLKQPSVTATSRAPVIDDVVDGNDDDSAAEEQPEQADQGGYGYAYTVLDESVGMDFGQWERREPGSSGTVTGLYRVRLPDGRTQTVEYSVGPATGYRASVTYEGVQRHPVAAPPPLAERYDSTGAETQSTD